MRGFSSYIASDLYLSERALDIELGEAADKWWSGVSKDAVSLMDGCLRLLGEFMGDSESGTFRDFNAVYEWSANMPTVLPEPKKAEWMELTRRYIDGAARHSSVKAKHEAVVRIGVSPDFPDSLVLQYDLTDRFTVIPKSLKKDADRHPRGREMFITLGGTSIVSKNHDKLTIGGAYGSLRSSRGNPDAAGKSSFSTVTVGEIKRLMFDNVGRLVYTMFRLRNKPTKMKGEITKWVDDFSADLKDKAKTGIHEYTHYLDAIRYKTPIDKSPKSWDVGAAAGWEGNIPVYFKSTHEWQAHFQDTATRLRKNLRSFLDAMVNKGVAATLILDLAKTKGGEKAAVDFWNGWNEHVRGSGYDAAKRGAAIADFIDRELKRIISSISFETTWKFGFKADQTIDMSNLKSNPFAAIAYSYMVKESYGATHWLKDDEMRKRFLKRIASLADDLRKITDDFYAELRSGKSPSKQRWNQAMDNVHHQKYLYVGSLMRSRATDVYDVRHFMHQYELG